MPAVADAYITQLDPAESHGSDSQLLVGDIYEHPYVYEYRALVLFNVLTIPADAYIVSARLNLFGSCQYVEEGTSLGVYRLLGNWSESDVCWNNKPAFAQTPTVTTNFSNDWTDEWLFLDVTEDVRLWHDGTANNGFLMAKHTASSLLLTLNSKEASCNSPYLEVSYITSAPALVVSACDNVTTKPINGLPVTVNINGMDFDRVTNESGYASVEYFYPSSSTPCNVTVSFDESATYDAGYFSSFLEFRFSTDLKPVGFENPRYVNTGINYPYEFLLGSSSLFGLKNMPVKFSINGTFVNGTVYNKFVENTSISNGEVSFMWAAPERGNYLINATFCGSDYNRPCQLFVSVSANSTALAVLFDASPREFVTGTNVVLNATIIDVAANRTISGAIITVEFLRFDSNGNNVSLQNRTTTSGVVDWSDQYPTDGKAYAYMARIRPDAGNLHQGIVCNPVQLTVSKATRLLLNVSRDWGSQNHTIQGWLLYQTTGINNRQVKIKVNETAYWSSVTDQTGHFSLSLNLQPLNNNATTYVITASFEDNSVQPLTATAWAKTLDGQQYPACTTTQYGYKPANNMTTLTISTQSTEVMTATMSSEDVQKQAEQTGALTFWHEWSWSYPWYRLHMKIHVNPTIDLGFNPLLPGGEVGSWDGLEFFGSLVGEVFQTTLIEGLTLLGTYLASRYLGIPFGSLGLIIEAGKIGLQLLLFLSDWNSASKMLAAGLVSLTMAFFALGMKAISYQGSVLLRFLEELRGAIGGTVLSVLNWMFVQLEVIAATAFDILGRSIVDIVEICSDMAIGVIALLRYVDLVT